MHAGRAIGVDCVCGKDNKFPDETSGDDKAVASNGSKAGAPPSSADKGKVWPWFRAAQDR